MLEHRQIVVFEGECRRFRFLTNVQRLTAPRIIERFERFERKMCQKKRKVHTYAIPWMFYFDGQCILILTTFLR